MPHVIPAYATHLNDFEVRGTAHPVNTRHPLPPSPPKRVPSLHKQCQDALYLWKYRQVRLDVSPIEICSSWAVGHDKLWCFFVFFFKQSRQTVLLSFFFFFAFCRHKKPRGKQTVKRSQLRNCHSRGLSAHSHSPRQNLTGTSFCSSWIPFGIW